MISEKSNQLVKEMVKEIMAKEPKWIQNIPCLIRPEMFIAPDLSQWLLPPIIESNNQEEQE